MAINTETKRRSVQAYTLGLMRPVADGSITVGDRATVAWLFAADSYPEPPTPTTPDLQQRGCHPVAYHAKYRNTTPARFNGRLRRAILELLWALFGGTYNTRAM